MTIWRPTASLGNLRRRAELLGRVRSFFAERGVLEVETPLLGAATVSDLHLASLSCNPSRSAADHTLYLQTSPEFAMKRLLAAHGEPIFQICKAFRDGEGGRLHNLEFTILEWYRPGWDHHRLMAEVDGLLAVTLDTAAGEMTTFRDVFVEHLGLDPLRAADPEIVRCAAAHGLDRGCGLDDDDRDGWLNLLLSHCVEPHLGRGRPTFVHDFPASQAALARIRDDDPPVAERFEVWVEGVELANGFHELTDADEQRRRFCDDLSQRHARGLPAVALDERLLAALEHGLPSSAGVALGFDRLVMLACGVNDIADVIPFPLERA
jgi:lysyl-tRNA synthetase class 2